MTTPLKLSVKLDYVNSDIALTNEDAYSDSVQHLSSKYCVDYHKWQTL